MEKREDKKEQTREKLLNSAAFCFSQKGYSSCSISDIAKHAQVAQGTMYIHFKNKEELFISMIQKEHEQGIKKIKEASSSSSPYLQSILNILTGCISDVGFPVNHRLWVEILAVTSREHSISSSFLKSDKDMRYIFTSLLKQAANNNEIDNSLDFEATSIWLYALVDGLIARVATDKSFDFQKHIMTFETLVKNALTSKQ